MSAAREKFISHSLSKGPTSLATMRTLVCILCFLAVVYCQTQNKNGNPTGEIGQPAFDEIVVESTLTVRGKSGSRGGKSLITNPSVQPSEIREKEGKGETVDGASVLPRRSRREPRQRFKGFAHENLGVEPFRNRFPSSSSSAAHASSNAFNSITPFNSFGASASQSSSQSQTFGPFGFQGSAGQSASQTYLLPNGNKINLSFSSSFNVNNGKPSASNSYSFTVTSPDGTVKRIPI